MNLENKEFNYINNNGKPRKLLVNDKNKKYKEYLKIQLKKFIEED